MDRITVKTNNIPHRETQQNVLPNIFGNALAKLVFVGVSIFLLYNVYHSIDITMRKVDILKQARQEVEALRVTNLELNIKLQDMQTPEYIEVEARDRLNFSGTKEVVFVIPDGLLSTAGERLHDIINGNDQESSKTVIERWEELIVHGV